MVSKKYITDYSLNYVPDKKGKLRATAVYQGKYYTFEKDKQVVKKAKVFLTTMLLSSTVLYVIPLLLEEVCTKKFYVLAPYALMVFPLFFAFCGLEKVITAKDQVTREHKDKAQPRLKGTTFLSMVLAFLSLVGQVVFAVKEKITFKNIVVFVCTLMCLICLFATFKRCKDVAMKEKI